MDWAERFPFATAKTARLMNKWKKKCCRLHLDAFILDYPL
jgi:hypothetical protein